MKISKLNIESYRHLENLNFDFTYQTGERKGQPLDKICFIGQSATGKTGLLELVYEQLVKALKLEIYIDGSLIGVKKIGLGQFKDEIHILFNKNLYTRKKNKFSYKNKSFETNLNGGAVENLISTEDKASSFYFKANIITDDNLKLLNTHPNDLYEKHKKALDTFNSLKINYLNLDLDTFLLRKKSYVFDEKIDEEIWLEVLNEFIIYLKKFTQKMSELIHQGLLADTKKLENEYEIWVKENPKKLLDFAEKINPLLIKIGLEIDQVDTHFSIPFKNTKKDEVVQIKDLSTGTKQLLLTSLPLYSLDTKDSIILIDEPERSLYPDMQMDLMEHYQRLAPDAQFIVATHSPFIAASFEPEERFILYFDEEGKVAVRRGTSPIGDDPNDMLYNDFGVDYINSKGKEAHKEYLDLKQQIYFEKDDAKKGKLLEKAEKLGDLYNF